MILSELKEKIENQTARLAVIGLGYVGLPVACEFARIGFDVLGIELKQDRVENINRGISPFEGYEPGIEQLLSQVVIDGKFKASSEYANIKDRDVILIAVETPVDENHVPRYDALKSVITSLGPTLKPGSLVIIESTIAPGTMDDVVLPLLEESSGFKANEDFFLGNCPERVMPGKLLENLRTVSRVVGGMSPETAEAMCCLYRHVVQADLDPADCVTAEIVKTAENAYRDVQIAFANEVALICEAVGGDVWKVRDLVNKSPGRNMLLPGAGVGGHCIPKDPWLLVHYARHKGTPLRLIPAARAVNDSMPFHIVDLLEAALKSQGKNISGSRILILGYAYLEDSDDARNSPSEALVKKLVSMGAEVLVHDPYIAEYKGNLMEMVRGCNGAVLMVRHRHYLNFNYHQLDQLAPNIVVIDGRNVLGPIRGSLKDENYLRLGSGASPSDA
jgi:UDP-N-acetyl-D-mannosaminuronic acid dehydrogenase